MDLDYANYFKFFLALVFVLGLIGLVALLMRYFGLGTIRGGRLARGAERRLQVVEAMVLDTRRRLVLVRRDGIEHLILLGTHDDILVEGNITPPESDQQPGASKENERRDLGSFVTSLKGGRN